jgi:hypothetical protein
VLFSSLSLIAQRSIQSNYFYEMELIELSKPNEAIRASKVKKIKVVSTSKKGSHQNKTELFNENGYLIGGEYFDKKGKLVYAFDVKLNDANQPVRIEQKGNKNTRIITYQYHSSGKLSKLTVSENDVLLYQFTKNFNEQNQLTETTVLNKKGLTSKSVYTYDDHGKMKLSETFNGKGKLIRRFDYSCTQEGEVAALSKVEKKVCTFDAFEDGYLIKIRETLDSKGNMSRVIDKFSASDTSLVETKYQNDNGNTSFLVKFQNNLETERTWYNNKGLEISKWIYMYNETGQKTLVQRWSKGVLSYENKWIYNEFGLCIRTEYSSAKQKNYLVYETEVLERY